MALQRVHGGAFNGTNLAGELSYFLIENAGFLAAHAGDKEASDRGTPGTLTERALRVIATRSTVVITRVVDGELHVALENNVQSWTAATLKTALDTALSTTFVVTQGDFTVA